MILPLPVASWLIWKLMSRKFFISTFGCRTNQADSSALRQSFLDTDCDVTRSALVFQHNNGQSVLLGMGNSQKGAAAS